MKTPFQQERRRIAEFNTSQMRAAVCGDAQGEEAYHALIEFDMNLCDTYDGFKSACDQVGLPFLTFRAWERLFNEIDAELDV